ncbi:MAG: hypothetical protein FJ087_06195 [Deltaproteobacteria bacterium]|nr:hypothetical protein [Deltaproteobacteria bacterium]
MIWFRYLMPGSSTELVPGTPDKPNPQVVDATYLASSWKLQRYQGYLPTKWQCVALDQYQVGQAVGTDQDGNVVRHVIVPPGTNPILTAVYLPKETHIPRVSFDRGRYAEKTPIKDAALSGRGIERKLR